MNRDKSLGLGLIGCGGFGRFCLKAFSHSQMPDVRIAATCDVIRDAAVAAADPYGASVYDDPGELATSNEVDIVHIATPPSTHHPLAMSVLSAGKHVLCEKPLAMNTLQADEMLTAAGEANAICPANFVLRYNQVTDATKRVIDSGVLGKVLSARLTNCASDSGLDRGHWFWDRDLSGGIFVEHGVHFFDLYRHWLGAGEVIWAHTERREGAGQEDRVTCTVRHDSGATASHYHGFDQVLPMDRTDHRIVCELGDIRVDGWIPLSLVVDAIVDDAGAEKLAACCDGSEIEVIETYGPADAARLVGRGRQRQATKRIRLTYFPRPDKQGVFADSVRALLADQIAYIRDRAHARRITEANGRDSLALAQAAVTLAQQK